MSLEELFHQEFHNLIPKFPKYYFYCNNFGHKALDCRYYARSDLVRNRNRGSYKTSKNNYVSNKTNNSHGFVDRNYNSFAPYLITILNVISAITMARIVGKVPLVLIMERLKHRMSCMLKG
jgi:hypothetical protein